MKQANYLQEGRADKLLVVNARFSLSIQNLPEEDEDYKYVPEIKLRME